LATVTAKQSIHKRWYFWAGLVGGLVVVGVATGVAVALTLKDVGYPSGTREVRF